MNWPSAMTSMRKGVALILVGVAVVFGGRAQQQDTEPASSKERPLVEIDLRKFGLEESSGTKRGPMFVDFTDVNHLALGWVTVDNLKASKKRGPLTSEPAHLHVLVLDARTGQKQWQQEWPAPSNAAFLLGAPDGRFLTCTGNLLRLFSSSFEVVREQNLPNDLACSSISFLGRPRVSSSRRSLLLFTYSGQIRQEMLLDTETFAVVASWISKLETNDISDHWLVGHCGEPSVLCIRGIGQSWQPFKPVGLEEQMLDPMHASLSFVNGDTLLVKAWDKAAVATVDGKVLFQVKLHPEHSFGTLVTSMGGERFAVIVNRQRGLTIELLDMYAFPSNDRVVVYSIPDRRAIWAVKVTGTSPWTPWELHGNRLALSPSGIRIAVVSDGILKVFRLPESNSR